jgi:hypothetical protein
VADLVCSPNAATAYDYFIGKGLRDFQAAAIVGNLQWESGIDPTLAVMDTNGQMSRGIAMWQPPRWQNLIAFAGSRNPLSLEVQLDFLWAELPSFGLSALYSSTQLQDAVVIFQNQFEKPNAALAHTDKRIALAQAALYACPAIKPPLIKSKAGVVAATVGLFALVTAAGYGIVKLFAPREEPEPLPLPPLRPSPFYRRRPF